MTISLNRVTLVGNLTKDPELRALASGTSVCKLRLAVNTRIKDKETGQWEDRPNYFDVTCWGATAENVAKYCTKGSGVLVDGELRWREWKADDGTNRQAVDVNAQKVIFMGGGKGGGDTGAGGGGQFGDPAADDDDIPF